MTGLGGHAGGLGNDLCLTNYLLIGGLAASGMVTAIAGFGFARPVNWCSRAAIFRPDQWWTLLIAARMVPFALMVWGRDLDRFRRWGCMVLDDAD